ncbi:hypothetical protein Barb7_02953 [Bacteroidales bacterium Barb7]|nr:hypothetical protein Barb7_02953 [Bacteroidales bacterium Barb7]
MQDIGVEVIVVLQTVGLAARTVRRTLFIAVNAKRTDAEAHPGLCQQNGTLQFTHQQVYILPPPIASPLLGISAGDTVTAETCIIGERIPRRRIGIEIIIHVNGIHVIAADYIPHDTTDKLPVFGNARVKKQLLVIGDKAFRIAVIDMAVRQICRPVRAGAVRVQPRMKLHRPLMALVNQESRYVKVSLRCPSLPSGVKAAPRLNLRTVKGIRLRSYLKDNGIDAAIVQIVQLADEIPLQLSDRHLPVFFLKGCLYPRSAKLVFRILCRRDRCNGTPDGASRCQEKGCKQDDSMPVYIDIHYK